MNPFAPGKKPTKVPAGSPGKGSGFWTKSGSYVPQPYGSSPIGVVTNRGVLPHTNVVGPRANQIKTP